MPDHNAEQERIEYTPYFDLAEPLYDCPSAPDVERAVWAIVAHAKAEALREHADREVAHEGFTMAVERLLAHAAEHSDPPGGPGATE